MVPEKAGTLGWIGMGVAVAAFDILAPETMSNAFKRAREHESGLVRAAAVGGLALIAAHLMDAIPEHFDPVDTLATVARRVIR